MDKLSNIEIENALAALSGWNYDAPFIVKKFIFKDHKSAFSFIAKVALIAEKFNHHPNWSGIYNEVVIKLSTHEVAGITAKDINFVKEIEQSL
jgi:4a-hydroxytetrahydrobiopterin dehydratase